MYYFILRQSHKRKIKKEIELYKDSDNVTFHKFSINSLPREFQNQTIILTDVLVGNGTQVEENDDIAVVSIGERQGVISAIKKGKVTFFKFSGESLRFGDYIYKIEKSN